MASDDQTLVIGLGRFGRALAETLTRLGNDVLGVDASPRVVQACAADMTHVVQADATDAEALRQIGAADFNRAAVTIGTDIAGEHPRDLRAGRPGGGPHLGQGGDARARRDPRARRAPIGSSCRSARWGSGWPTRWWAARSTTSSSTRISSSSRRRRRASSRATTLKDAKLRSRYEVTVVAVKTPEGGFTYATPETVVRDGDLMVVAGRREKAEGFAALP